MMKAKKALTYIQLIELLNSRGLCFDDLDNATLTLKKTNYYRLSAYFRFFQNSDLTFKPDVTLERVLEYYNYDLKLKSFLFKHVVKIEAWLKTEIAYFIAHNSENDFSYFKYKTSKIYYDTKVAKEVIEKIVDRCNKNHELELRRLYSSEHHRGMGIPIWIGVELLTFGELLMFYKCLFRDNQLQIMSGFDFKNLRIFIEVLNSLRILRNICAHNERLWNNSFTSPRKLIRKGHEIWEYVSTKRITAYCLASITKFLDIEESNNLINEFIELTNEYKIPLKPMGFVKDISDLT